MKKGEVAPSPYQKLLSERELEVLRLMAEGLSNQQIADRLIISLSTTKNHVHNILEKLYVQGRTQAVTQVRKIEFILLMKSSLARVNLSFLPESTRKGQYP